MSNLDRLSVLLQACLRSLATVLVVSFLLLRSPSVEAYAITMVGGSTVHGQNVNFSLTPHRISLFDYFNQYDETRWEISSSVEDGSGGVRVTYNYPFGYGTWDSYSGRVETTFRILSDFGNPTPEPVTVDVWGASFLDAQYRRACCISDSPQVDAGPIRFYATQHMNEYDPATSLVRNISLGVLASSYTLFSNTDYNFSYLTTLYVEGSPSNLPEYFASRNEYNAFVAANGTAGRVFSSAYGFASFNMALRPASVPEPGTLSLLGLGLAGLGFARRRKLI